MKIDILQDFFKTAIKIELTVISFYNLVAESSTNLKLRNVFCFIQKKKLNIYEEIA